MRESGLSTCDIAEEVGVHRTTVYRWLKRWDEEGNLRDHSKPGRARKTTAEEDRRIREYFETHPFSNAIAAREHLQLDLSAETIWPFLQSPPNVRKTVPNTFGCLARFYSCIFRLTNTGERYPNHPKYWNKVSSSDSAPTSELLPFHVNKIICNML
ncbi:hypothetical protein Pmani_019863 [Petrolisthes manimaculis]|uniref:Transposase n=1 Tax=Petrolisthes manimaculis TaxID=1843537 RepID=A0AAE1PJW3_9EUCA|nr:hypothetical protein Pmani_019863 [Petrolisthes manimaculis]